MLADLSLRQSYRSDEHDIIREFYIPCFSCSTLYQRAVGFFSSSSLSVAAKGLHVFLRSGGSMQLVASPNLSPADVHAIQQGYANRREIEERALVRALEGNFDQIVRERLGFLAWLIEYGRLDIKLAVLKSLEPFGVYHEKLGIFTDGRDFVVFTGSPNESASGLVNNFECIDVYCSWRSEDYERVKEKLENFARLWENRTRLLDILPFPEAAKRRLIRFRQPTVPTEDPELTHEHEVGFRVISNQKPKRVPIQPKEISLRPYQLEAIENWFRAGGRGTLKMATGSGKTITALAIVERLYREAGLQAAIVIVPFRHLVAQWDTECKKFGMEPIKCFESRRVWMDNLQSSLFTVGAFTSGFLSVITTNATFISEAFQGLLPYFPKKTIIIADEAHNMGSKQIATHLPVTINLRLALSATPERWFDDRGSNAIFEYFGSVLQPEFTLKDAIKVGALVPYYYYPIFITLTDDEMDEYVELSHQIARLIGKGDVEEGEVDESPILRALMSRRSRLLGAARNKLVALKTIMQNRLDTTHTLFYCGDGTVEQPASQVTMRHIEAVSRLLGGELSYRVDMYTAETPLEERMELRDRFINGDLQGIVAIRCLDEGVDIPMIRTAFILASSTNPRQFIQRRGRVLRPYPGKPHAEIFDFIAVPPDSREETFEVERGLLRRELQRYAEFADLALNAGEARGKLVDLQSRYGLLSI